MQETPQTNHPALRKRKRWPWVIGILLVIIVISAIVANGSQGNASSSSSTPTTQSSSSTQSPSTHPTSAPQPQFATFGDGTFIVGKDIQPGTYRTRTSSPNCYYARLKGFSGAVEDIIANDNTDDPAIVTISASDKGFESTNCGTWTKDLSAITTSKTSFSDGAYFVGTDITPGTYKSSGHANCYYARLSGFGGSTGDILANNNTDTPAVVTIASGDKGFLSKSCGTWTKI